MSSLDLLHIDLDEILAFVGEATYPITKEELISQAESRGANQDVLEALKSLPGQTFQTVGELESALGDLKQSGEQTGYQVGQQFGMKGGQSGMKGEHRSDLDDDMFP